MEKEENLRYLFARYANGLSTREEYDQFLRLIADAKEDKNLRRLLDELWVEMDGLEVPGFVTAPVERKPVISRMYRYVAAASIVIGVTICGYFLLHKKDQPQVAAVKNDIAPGHNQATLTLANGRKIVLRQGMSGKLALQGNVMVQVDAGKGITYSPSDQTDNTLTNVAYNTLTTKRGEASPYALVLPDGSQVWLNAASSITFPTAFYGKERSVTVTGEAYVIVAHNAKQPFKLIAGGQAINDIGTEFNINAYNDEPVVTTTLAEGSINITKNNKIQTIKPGQQALTKTGSDQITVEKADVSAAIAWKNGKFDFNNADVPSVMRQMARWYDVDVEYEGGIPQVAINGSVFRKTTASNALKIVRLLGIPYRIEGHKIIITNNKQNPK